MSAITQRSGCPQALSTGNTPPIDIPHQGISLKALMLFPDGDYFVHMTADLWWGTFGHPWQQTLTIWGDELVADLGAGLLT